MADLKTTQEAPAAALTGAELIRGVQSGANVKMTTGAIAGLGYQTPTTSKGDLIVRGASADARQAVGANGAQLVADSTQATGVKWYDAVGALVTSLAASTGSALLGFAGLFAGAIARTSQSKHREWISVLDYGADPTGASDSTAAFNLATQAAATFSAALQYNIIIPSGKYLINGTVYVRAGQTLWGQGHGTLIVCTGTPSATPNFVLGSGASGNDNSGSPVKIGNFQTLGGGGAAGVIKSIQAGFTIADVFMSAPGIGIDCQGSDGLIYGVEVDQALTGIILAGGNIEITNSNFYLANYAISLTNGLRDVSISNCEFEYSQYAAILYPTGANNIRGITLTGCNFIMNQQFGTFLGYIVMQSGNSEFQAVGCAFRNMYNWAVNHNTGVSNQLLFTGCVFDGAPTTSDYAASTTAKALNTPSGGASVYDFQGCEFRNLLGEIATVSNGLTSLVFMGGLVSNCPQTRLNTSGLTDVPKITIKGLKGISYVANTANAQAIVLPYWGASTVWKVAAKGNTLTPGNSAYAAAEESAFTVTYEFSGSGSTYVDKAVIWQTPARAFPPQLAMAACFGTAPGGSASQAGVVQAGTICVSVSVTAANASNFDWYAETAL